MAKPGRPKSTRPTRSHTISVRLEPILMLAVELAAAKDRRSASSFIDMACREAAQKRHVALDQDDNPISALALAERVWAPDPELQALRLTLLAPPLIPTEYQLLGEAIIYFCRELDLLEAQALRKPDLKAVEARAREAWARSPDLQAEFEGRFENYLAYKKAKARDLVRFPTKAPEPRLETLMRAAQAALPEIKAAIQGDAIDYKRIADLAYAALARRIVG